MKKMDKMLAKNYRELVGSNICVFKDCGRTLPCKKHEMSCENCGKRTSDSNSAFCDKCDADWERSYAIKCGKELLESIQLFEKRHGITLEELKTLVKGKK